MLKKIISLLLTGVVAFGSAPAVFAMVDYTGMDDYRKEEPFFSEDFESGSIDSGNWELENASITVTDDVFVYKPTTHIGEIKFTDKLANKVSFGGNSVRKGTVAYGFSLKSPKPYQLSKDMLFSLRTAEGKDVPLFKIDGSGYQNRGSMVQILEGSSTSGCYDIWTDGTFLQLYIVVDTETGVVKLIGPSFQDISSRFNLDYYSKNQPDIFKSGVTSVVLTKESNDESTIDGEATALYIDDVSICEYYRAYEEINKLKPGENDKVTKILTAYNKAVVTDINDVYISIPKKTSINEKLIAAELESDDDINAIIAEELGRHDKESYVDLTNLYNADFIGKAGEIVPQDSNGGYSSFGIDTKNGIWSGIASSTYTGQGFDGEKILAQMTEDGIITAFDNWSGDITRTFKIPKQALSVGTKDALAIRNTKNSDGTYTSDKHRIKLSGKRLLAVRVAAAGATAGSHLSAVINYADGTTVDLKEDGMYLIPESGDYMSENYAYYQTKNFGYMVYPNSKENGKLVNDTRSTSNNRKTSRITVIEISTDVSKRVNSIDLYVSTSNQNGTVAIFGVTELPIQTESLMYNIDAVSSITKVTANNKSKVIRAYGGVRELIDRGFCDEDDENAVRITELYNSIDSESVNYIIDASAKMYGKDGSEVKRLEDAESVAAAATCKNTTGADKTAIFAEAFYDSKGNIISVRCSEKKTISNGETGKLEIEKTGIPEKTEMIKLLVWDSLDGIKPVREQTVITK